MYLFFDTETTELPRNNNAPVTDLNNWPRLVQLAYLQYDRNSNKISGCNFVIKPNGFIIPKDVLRIHGITHEKTTGECIPLSSVLQQFNSLINQSEILIAHNLAFDEKITGAEFLRSNKTNPITVKRKICKKAKELHPTGQSQRFTAHLLLLNCTNHTLAKI